MANVWWWSRQCKNVINHQIWSRIVSSSSLSSSLPSLLHQNTINNAFNTPQYRTVVSIKAKHDVRKLERLLTLRVAVCNNYRANIAATGGGSGGQQQQSSPINWNTVREQLEQSGALFRSNFEFALLTAFDDEQFQTLLDGIGSPGGGGNGGGNDIIAAAASLIPSDRSTLDMDYELFQSIASFVSTSSAIATNRIAAVRLCVFLASHPEYLTLEQRKFIRTIADQIYQEPITLAPIIMDIVRSLARSSPDNARHALQIYHPRWTTLNRKLHLELQRIIFTSLVQYELFDEMLGFLSKNHQTLDLDRHLDLVGSIIRGLAKKKCFAEQPEKVLQMLRHLGDCYALIDVRYRNTLVERILKRKLGYVNIDMSANISTNNGKCSICGHHLRGITTDEFAQLRTHFSSIIFDKNDQLLMRNLPEFAEQYEKFQKLFQGNDDQCQHFSLVIDSLNIGYGQSAAILPDNRGLRQYVKVYKSANLDHHLLRIITQNQLLKRFNSGKVLIIGRKHMLDWRNFNVWLKQNRQQVKSVLLLNKTRDDQYILYAAIQDCRTRILTNDYFRDHREKFIHWYESSSSNDNDNGDGGGIELRPNLPRLFQRWLHSSVVKLTRNTKYPQLIYPPQYDRRIHVDDNATTTTSKSSTTSRSLPHLHIPIVVKRDAIDDGDQHEIEWICAKPN